MISSNEPAGAGPEAAPPLTNILEALLFATSESLSLARITAILKEYDAAAVKEALSNLGERCEKEGRPYGLEEIGGGYRLLTRSEYGDYIRRLQKVARGDRLTPASLETLAIVAYKQPVIKAEVDAIRGVKSDGTLQSLLRRHLIRVVGRADVLGRPLLYGTTKLFLDQFGLKNLDDLPSPEEALEKMEAEELPPLEEGLVTRVDLDAGPQPEDPILMASLPEAPAFRKDRVLEAAEEEKAAGERAEQEEADSGAGGANQTRISSGPPSRPEDETGVPVEENPGPVEPPGSSDDPQEGPSS